MRLFALLRVALVTSAFGVSMALSMPTNAVAQDADAAQAAPAEQSGAEAQSPATTTPLPTEPITVPTAKEDPLAAFNANTVKEPPMPLPLQESVRSGAQARYLGKHGTLNGWVIVKGGKPEFHYATEDGKSILMGILFDSNGNMVTGEQMRMLRLRDGATSYALSDLVNTQNPSNTIKAPPSSTPTKTRVPPRETGLPSDYDSLSAPAQTGTPQAQAEASNVTSADLFYAELEAGNWIRIGNAQAPVIYAFIDPDCEHCQAFLKDIRLPYLERGLVQVRALPVGFTEMSLKRAAYLLASPDPESQLMRYIDGETQALFVPGAIQTQGAEKNISLMTKWKLSGTPIIAYKNKDGIIRFVRGRPDNIAVLIDEIDTKW